MKNKEKSFFYNEITNTIKALKEDMPYKKRTYLPAEYYAEFLDHLFLLERNVKIHKNDEVVDEELSWILSINSIKDDTVFCKMILDVLGDNYEN